MQLLVRYVFGGVYDIQSDKIILISTPQIANSLKGELDKAKEINYTLPSKESTMVQKWQSDFTSAFVTLTRLNSTAKSFPGNPAAGVCSSPFVHV